MRTKNPVSHQSFDPLVTICENIQIQNMEKDRWNSAIDEARVRREIFWVATSDAKDIKKVIVEIILLEVYER